VIHSDVIEAAGAPTVASAPVGREGSIIRIPFRYRHTAVLTEDVVGYSITVPGVQAPAGAPGYYAGTFIAVGGWAPQSRGPGDMWCFLPSLAGGEREHLCLYRSSPSIAAIAPTRMNPYLWTQFSPATGSFDYVKAPVFERRAVNIPGELVLEYRFQGWSRNAVRLSEYAVGREVRDFALPRGVDGTARLRTVVGDIGIAPHSDPERAVVELVGAPARSHSDGGGS
jgi:hypothetical protein